VTKRTIAAFQTLDWLRPDVRAIVAGRGLLTVSKTTMPRILAWIEGQEYSVALISLRPGRLV
jgi:hypothetical protein